MNENWNNISQSLENKIKLKASRFNNLQDNEEKE
jgi:hypothetical protein